MKRDPVVFVFNAPLSSGCDYVMQTMSLVARKHPVYGIALGDILPLRAWIARPASHRLLLPGGITVYKPVAVLPGLRFVWVRNAIYAFTASIVRLRIARTHPGSRKLLWFFEPFHLPAVLRVFGGYETVYDCVDYYPGFSSQAARQHGQLLNMCDWVCANSGALADTIRPFRPDVRTVPAGCAHILFPAPREGLAPDKRTLRIGYVGSISERMDFGLLMSVARRLSGDRFVFVGPEERNVFGRMDSAAASFRALLRLPNVEWTGRVPKRTVPETIGSFDIAVIPYRTDLSFNRYAFPMKLLEYFAAGKPVITASLETYKQYESRALVFAADTADAFVRAVSGIRRRGWSIERIRQQRRIAVSHSWERKVTAVLRMVGRA